MSETPLFDDVAAVNPEIDITVHEEDVELRTFLGPAARIVRHDRLEFNYLEPYRGVAPMCSPHSHPSMPKDWK